MSTTSLERNQWNLDPSAQKLVETAVKASVIEKKFAEQRL
uniref:Transcriptional regulator n=1 Tax=Heterorhabditis bacteriophora TaxID=37862 RepID=A0A1I7WJI4_HETBA